MPLWIVVYLTGQIAMTIGPVPYEMDECLRRVAEKQAWMNEDEFKRHVGRTNDLTIRCEYHEQRPTLGP